MSQQDNDGLKRRHWATYFGDICTHYIPVNTPLNHCWSLHDDDQTAKPWVRLCLLSQRCFLTVRWNKIAFNFPPAVFTKCLCCIQRTLGLKRSNICVGYFIVLNGSAAVVLFGTTSFRLCYGLWRSLYPFSQITISHYLATVWDGRPQTLSSLVLLFF